MYNLFFLKFSVKSNKTKLLMYLSSVSNTVSNVLKISLLVNILGKCFRSLRVNRCSYAPTDYKMLLYYGKQTKNTK